MNSQKSIIPIAAASIMLLSALIPLVGAIPAIHEESELSVWQGQEEGPSYQAEDGNEKDIFLYFHRTTSEGDTYVLNTAGGSNGADVLPSDGSVKFEIEEPLTKDLEVVGHEVDSKNKGFWLDLTVSAFPSAQVTIEIMDGDLVIANKTRDISGTWDRWTIPFVSRIDSYTFSKDSIMGVRISTTGSTTVNYQSNDKLWVLCDPVSLTGDTYNYKHSKTRTFQPNTVEEERIVNIEGKVKDAWGEGDVSNVYIKIKNPEGEVLEEGTAEMDGLNYTYEWNYSTGLTSGTYSVNVTMEDQQDNTYEKRLDFTMSTYGVHLDSPQEEEEDLVTGSVETGGCIEYTVSVKNTGAVSTSYSLSRSSSEVPGWTLAITPSQTGTIQPGESKIVNVKVCSDDSVEEGTQSVFYIQAVANGDPSAKDTLQIITNSVAKINLSLNWIGGTCSNLVNTGGMTECVFEMKNSGLKTLNVTLTMSVQKGEGDWTVSVEPASILNTEIELYKDQTVQGTLNVTAPDDPSAVNESIVNLKAQTTDTQPPISKTLTAKTIMSTGISLSVVGDDTKEIESDEEAEFYILVSNTDPSSEHSIILEPKELSGWSVEFVATSSVFSLKAQESKNVNVKITPKENSPAGDYDIEIVGRFQTNTQVWDKVGLTVTIKERHDLDITVTPKKVELDAGESAEFQVVIENLGNVDEKNANMLVDSVGGDLEADIEVDGKNEKFLSLDIPRGQSATITVVITPGDEVSHKDSGTYKIQIKGVQGTSDSENVKVKVVKELDSLFMEVMVDYQIWILIVLVVVVLFLFVMVRRR